MATQLSDATTTIQMVIISIAAPSKTGKTTFLEHLIPILIKNGLQVGYLKHSHHPLSDSPQSDSKRIQRTGAVPCMATTSHDFHTEIQPFQQCQIVLVEGFRSANLETILLLRGVQDQSWTVPQKIICRLDISNLEQALLFAQELIYTKLQWSIRSLSIT